MNMKAFSLKQKLIAVTMLLVVLVLGLGSVFAYNMLDRRSTAVRTREINVISDLLLRSAGDWAVERGVTNTQLSNDAPIGSGPRAEIDKRRAAADAAYKSALESLQAWSFSNKAELMKKVSSAAGKLQEMRQRVDEELQKPKGERARDVIDGLVPAVTAIIETSQQVRRALEYDYDTAASRMARFQQLKDAVWVMSEFAGRQRAVIGGVLAQKTPLDSKTTIVLSEAQGRVLAAWETVRAIGATSGISSEVVSAIADVQNVYFGSFGELRGNIMAAGAWGGGLSGVGGRMDQAFHRGDRHHSPSQPRSRGRDGSARRANRA